MCDELRGAGSSPSAADCQLVAEGIFVQSGWQAAAAVLGSFPPSKELVQRAAVASLSEDAASESGLCAWLAGGGEGALSTAVKACNGARLFDRALQLAQPALASHHSSAWLLSALSNIAQEGSWS